MNQYLQQQTASFLKERKALLQVNGLDNIFQDPALITPGNIVSDSDVTDYLINLCDIPILNYMDTLHNSMFAYFHNQKLIIPENIKHIVTKSKYLSLFHRCNIGTLTINSIANELLRQLDLAQIGTIIINDDISYLDSAIDTCNKIGKIVIKKSCTRLLNGFSNKNFIIETPYRENPNEKLRISAGDVEWAKTHVKFISDVQTEELSKKKKKPKKSQNNIWYFPDIGDTKTLDIFNNSVDIGAENTSSSC